MHVLQVYTLRSVSENQKSMFDASFYLSLTCFMAQVFSLKFKLAICVSKQGIFLFSNTGNCVTRTCPHSQHLTVDERTDLALTYEKQALPLSSFFSPCTLYFRRNQYLIYILKSLNYLKHFNNKVDYLPTSRKCFTDLVQLPYVYQG